jgi:hypothetical protein
MKDTIKKDKRRKVSFIHKEDYENAWKLSLKYSSILMKNMDSCDIYFICCSLYGEYINDIDNKGYKKNRNYVQIWDTMLNTVRKGEKITLAIRLLHQTNCQRVS